MKSRYWSFIVYPESTIKDWKSKLEELGIPFAVSPLHDKDIDPTGEPKKAHWHVLVQFTGPTTYKNVKENICDLVNATIPKKVISLRGYYRYLAHLDNPEKAQYNVEEIEKHCGFELSLTETETTILVVEILLDIERNQIREYKDIVDLYLETGEMDKLDIVSHKTYFIDKYITSGRHKDKGQIQSMKR